MSKTVPTEASSDAGPTGYLASRLNAIQHGILSRFTVLPWESADAYVDLLAALVKERQPVGVTEEHLVEELAGVMWRKQRLQLAEAAVHRAGLQDACGGWRAEQTVRNALAHLPGDLVSREGLIEAVRASDQDTAAELRELDEEETRIDEALEVLRGGRAAAYARASAVLGEDAREAWQDALEAAGDGGHPDREPGPSGPTRRGSASSWRTSSCPGARGAEPSWQTGPSSSGRPAGRRSVRRSWKPSPATRLTWTGCWVC